MELYAFSKQFSLKLHSSFTTAQFQPTVQYVLLPLYMSSQLRIVSSFTGKPKNKPFHLSSTKEIHSNLLPYFPRPALNRQTSEEGQHLLGKKCACIPFFFSS
uniref:Uncharacterized protein n=1 Tax=Sphaerodactylus townsendi TaxID=933632 RepID=A0ACB8ERL6_9SAUR